MNPTISFWIGFVVGLVVCVAVFAIVTRKVDPAREFHITTYTESPGREFYLVGLVSGRKAANSKLADRIGDPVQSFSDEHIVFTDGRVAHAGDCIWRITT